MEWKGSRHLPASLRIFTNEGLPLTGKKEQDDGDVDVFSRRIRAWKHERKEAEIDESSQLYHILDDEFKVPQDIWDKLYK